MRSNWLSRCGVFLAGGLAALWVTPAYTQNRSAGTAMPSQYNWTGFYIGGNIGGLRHHDQGTSNFTQPFAAGGLPNNPQSQSNSNTSFVSGGQIGYNWQFAPRWVLGVEADWQWTKADYSFCRQTDNLSLSCADNNRGFLTISSETNWLATLRGRLGFIWDRYMIYGTGGVAWAGIDTTLTADCAVGGCGDSSVQNVTSVHFSDTKSGWTAGVGIEAMLTPNWTARAEWLHADLGSLTNSFTSSAALGPHAVSWSRDLRYDIIRFGLNYKFGGSVAVAK